MQTLVTFLTGALMFAGMAGTLLPFIPGCPLILGGALLYAWYTGFGKVSWGTLIFLLLLTLLREFLEKGTTFIGAKKYGASRWGLVGVLLGGIGGLILGGPLGLILGPFLGAVILEILHGRAVDGAFRAGFGAIIGMLGGVLGKLLIALIMIGVFLRQLAG
ncbi:MAG: hypothetical protein H6Q42_2605 [Deltaproteobacteria bacterium]|nr:hypothetical protein [Deltaproteobacteria bacterium]